MKKFIRILLCLASGCLVVANLRTSKIALVASCLFLLANGLSLIYNEFKGPKNIRDFQKNLVKFWNSYKE